MSADTDNDNLTDYDECITYHTDPLKVDSDGDGYSDWAEIEAGTDPLDSSSHPTEGTPGENPSSPTGEWASLGVMGVVVGGLVVAGIVIYLIKFRKQ